MTDFYDYKTYEELDALEARSEAHLERQFAPQLRLFSPYKQGDGLPGFIQSLLPQAFVKSGNPVFAYELRGVGFPHGRRDLWWRGWRATLNGVVSALVIWGISLGLLMGLSNALIDNPEPDFRYTIMWIVMAFFGAGVVLSSFVVDAVIIFTVAFSSGDKDPVQRDLIRLSGINTDGLVRARFAAVQVKAWRLLWLGIGWRLGLLLFGLLNMIITPLLIPGLDAQAFFSNSNVIQISPLIRGTLVIGMAVLALLLVVEPVWRMRALAAAGLEAGSAGRPSATITIYCSGALVSIWLIQMALVAVAFIWMFVSSAALLCIIATPPALALVLGGSLRGMYGGLQIYWLNSAYKRLHGDLDS